MDNCLGGPTKAAFRRLARPVALLLAVVVVVCNAQPSDTMAAGSPAPVLQSTAGQGEELLSTVGFRFLLGPVGSITDAPTEVISGSYSIKGSYTGTQSYSAYLRTVPAALRLNRRQTYQVTFKYRILVTPDRGFECIFCSPTGGAAGVWLAGVKIDGVAGATGTATWTNEFGPYDDDDARWNIVGTGAIAIDDVQIATLTTAEVVATEDAEAGPTPCPIECASHHLFPRLATQVQQFCPPRELLLPMADWDLLVVDAELTGNDCASLLGPRGSLREKNRNLVILGYHSAADVFPTYGPGSVNGDFIAGLQDGWYKKDTAGRRVKLAADLAAAF